VNAFDLCRFGLFAAFLAIHLPLWLGLLLEARRSRRPARPGGEADQGGVSVVVPVRNEAARIGPLLESLARQDLPGLEAVFVDDRSTDASPDMLRAFAGRCAGSGLTVTILTLAANPGPNHKQYALGRGIAAAHGDVLLLTDADCEAPPGWAREMTASLLACDKTGAVLGPVLKKETAHEAKRGGTFFSRYQCYDHAVRYLYLAGSAGVGAAGGGFGNNLALRRAALEAAGGYGAIPASPTEDAALVASLRANTGYAVRAVFAPEARVFTASEPGWAALVNQTLRWQTGGLFGPDWKTSLGYSAIMYPMSLETLAAALLPFFPALWPLPAAPACVMLVNTIALCALLRGSLPRPGPDYPLLALFTPVFFTFLTLLAAFRVKFRWRE